MTWELINLQRETAAIWAYGFVFVMYVAGLEQHAFAKVRRYMYQ